MRNALPMLDDPAVLDWMRDSVLRDLISNSDREKQHIRRKFSVLNVQADCGRPAIALFESEMVAEDERERENERIRDVLRKGLPRCVVYRDGERRTGLLFPWSLVGEVRSLRAQMSENCAGAVSIGIGAPCPRLEDIQLSYAQAEGALKAKFYRGAGQIILFSELEAYEELEEYPLAREKELLNRIKLARSPAEIEREVAEYYRFLLRNGPVEICQIQEMTLRLLAGTEKKIVSDSGEARASLRHEIMSVLKSETLQELMRFVVRYCVELKEWMAGAEGESVRSVIKRTLSYMEQECRDASLDKMARKVYMTPSYLSMLFKVNTGKTFIEQLTDIRIDKAKDMLKNTCMRNYEVAEQVGYQDSRYFSQLFKKRVGLSPSQYRELQER
ncbi:helix-turn-helix domain-containing protein [Cohnella boryungensis]|uniref:Helix-turn-helix domain-containing protein n=1 Tax=Cohnella boryungensis TaxID=768479 RepID=A0ABV8SFP1_9BACL